MKNDPISCIASKGYIDQRSAGDGAHQSLPLFIRYMQHNSSKEVIILDAPFPWQNGDKWCLGQFS